MDYLCPECGPIDEDTGLCFLHDEESAYCTVCGSEEEEMTPLVDAYRKLRAERDELRQIIRGLMNLPVCTVKEAEYILSRAYAVLGEDK